MRWCKISLVPVITVQSVHTVSSTSNERLRPWRIFLMTDVQSVLYCGDDGDFHVQPRFLRISHIKTPSPQRLASVSWKWDSCQWAFHPLFIDLVITGREFLNLHTFFLSGPAWLQPRCVHIVFSTPRADYTQRYFLGCLFPWFVLSNFPVLCPLYLIYGLPLSFAVL